MEKSGESFLAKMLSTIRSLLFGVNAGGFTGHCVVDVAGYFT